jgi:hypothetical protein
MGLGGEGAQRPRTYTLCSPMALAFYPWPVRRLCSAASVISGPPKSQPYPRQFASPHPPATESLPFKCPPLKVCHQHYCLAAVPAQCWYQWLRDAPPPLPASATASGAFRAVMSVPALLGEAQQWCRPPRRRAPLPPLPHPIAVAALALALIAQCSPTWGFGIGNRTVGGSGRLPSLHFVHIPKTGKQNLGGEPGRTHRAARPCALRPATSPCYAGDEKSGRQCHPPLAAGRPRSAARWFPVLPPASP